MIPSTVAIQTKQGNLENHRVPVQNDSKVLNTTIQMGPSILEKYFEIDGQLYKRRLYTILRSGTLSSILIPQKANQTRPSIKPALLVLIM